MKSLSPLFFAQVVLVCCGLSACSTTQDSVSAPVSWSEVTRSELVLKLIDPILYEELRFSPSGFVTPVLGAGALRQQAALMTWRVQGDQLQLWSGRKLYGRYTFLNSSASVLTARDAKGRVARFHLSHG